MVGCRQESVKKRDTNAQKRLGRLLVCVVLSAGPGGRANGAKKPAPIALPLTSQLNHDDWSVDVRLGDAATPIALSVDLGSATTGVVSSLCKDGCDGLWPRYPAPASAAAATLLSSRYGDGSYGFTGRLVRESMQLPGLSAVPVWMLAIVDNSLFVPAARARGILGLAPAALLVAGTESYAQQLQAADGGTGMFGLQLCNPNGWLWWGGFDAQRLSAPLAYTPLLVDGYWHIAPRGVALGDAAWFDESRQLAPFLLDNGIDEARLPRPLYDAVVAVLMASPSFLRAFPRDFAQEHDRCLPAAPGWDRAALDAALPRFRFLLPRADGHGEFELPLGATASYLSPYIGAYGEIVAYCNRLAPTDGAGTFSSPYMRGLLLVMNPAQQRLGLAPHRGCDAAAAPDIDAGAWR